MKILGIETSSPLFSLCVTDDETLIYEVIKNREMDAKTRDAEFFLEAQKIFRTFGGEIKVIVVSIGPGMFTSLRIGLSLAKALAFTHDIPIVAVNTLDIIGIPLSFLQTPVLAAINAYHQELYAAQYRNGERILDYMLTTAAELNGLIQEQTLVVGSGVDLFKKVYPSGNAKFELIEGGFNIPLASNAVRLALPRISAEEYDNSETIEPFYIKKTDAERNYNKTHGT